MQLSPLTLFWLALGALFLALVFYPGQGLLARFKAWRVASSRQQVEDTLKYLFEQEQEGYRVTPDALAGMLGASQRAVLNLLIKIDSQGLATRNNHYVTLTPEGRRLAVQVTRAHRLWERYLADEARMPLEQIHGVAHKREHGMSSAEVDALDADLGFPTHDPHGDPIPDPSGALRLKEAPTIALPGLQAGQRGRVAHLEDEPPIAYAQLVAEGFYPGQNLTILEKNLAKIVVTDGEKEMVIAPAIAANIFLQPAAEEAKRPEGVISLDRLSYQTQAEVIELDERCQGYTRRRFLDLGLTPGTRIFPELNNAFREPRAYRVRGTLIALRNDQAAMIWVMPLDPINPIQN
jgi:DtxR family Mn-dependent transcriptional regulator